MHPLLKRILLNGALTAAILAGVGLVFAQFAGMMFNGGGARPGSGAVNASAADALRMNVPVMMAFWGFVFVAVCEALRWVVRGAGRAAAKPAELKPDTAEKLLNELLTQAEAKMAAEKGAGGQEVELKS